MSLKPLASWKLLPVWGGLVVLTAFVLFSDFGCGVVNLRAFRAEGDHDALPRQAPADGAALPASPSTTALTGGGSGI